MTTRMILSLGASALILGGTVVGCTLGYGGIASASTRSADAAAKSEARTAGKALARRDAAAAVKAAEAAVALMPRDAGYRALLGQGYLAAGRFASARSALDEAMTLAPADGRVALNLALAQIACGDWADARATLTVHAAQIGATDRGLALALAGDPNGGVALLTVAARSPGATVKTRQNLALALALAGQWQGARVVASADMDPAAVDQRMQQWAAFAQPHAAADQVAALLGVTAAADTGRPVALALATDAPVQVAAQMAAVSPVAATVTAPEPAAAPKAMAPALAAVVFGPRHDVVQPLPVAPVRSAALIRAASGPIKVAVAKDAPVASSPSAGSYYVQLGAFASAGVAKDAWGRATRRLPGLAAHGPSGMRFASKAGAVYRLSVGGFARGEADRMCRSYRAHGGVCFVRSGAGDTVAQWVRKGNVAVAAKAAGKTPRA